MAKSRLLDSNADIIHGSAFDIPYKDNYFDIVFTSGVLIHIAPDGIQKVLKEIHRCAKKYIFGYEYYSPTLKNIPYREHTDMLWKQDFVGLYMGSFGDLKLIKEELYDYKDGSGNQDQAFLLEKVVEE